MKRKNKAINKQYVQVWRRSFGDEAAEGCDRRCQLVVQAMQAKKVNQGGELLHKVQNNFAAVAPHACFLGAGVCGNDGGL